MLRNGSWIRVDLLLQQIDGCIELSVRSGKSGVGRVVDHDVRFDAVALDEPYAVRAVDPGFSGCGHAVIGLSVAAR